MTVALRPSPSACPACDAAPAALAAAEAHAAAQPGQILLSLPTIHCAACITKIERGLRAHPGVQGVRVNLTLKRATITAAPDINAGDMITLRRMNWTPRR